MNNPIHGICWLFQELEGSMIRIIQFVGYVLIAVDPFCHGAFES